MGFVLENNESFDHLKGEIDQDKRETLIKLSKAAWAVPVVATFGLSALDSSSPAWAQVGNGTTTS